MYSAIQTVVLISPQFEPAIDSLKDLVNQPHGEVIPTVVKDSSLHYLLMVISVLSIKLEIY